MLKSFFSSNSRIKILKLFLLSSGNEYEKEFFVREIMRELDEQINSVRRELENLQNTGMLTSRMRNGKKYYKVNPDFILLPELKSIFKKDQSPEMKILKKIKKMGRLDFLALTGSFVNKNGNVDLVAVGNIDKKKLSNYLSVDFEIDIGREVRYSVLSREDFLHRVEYNDRFSIDLLKDPENVILVNKIEKELSGKLQQK